MPSTRGFAARRRGVRGSRLAPVDNDASTDVSVQHGEAFTPRGRTPAERDVYVCGSTAFCDAATRLIASAGVPSERIKVERFGFSG